MGIVYHILIAINVTWLIARLIDAVIGEYIVPLAEKTESSLDDQIIPVVRKGMRSVIWILGIIVALNNAGYDVGALIAGLGIGGLALAMAAKDSVANIFGGIMIFTDKPFKVGDRIKINGFDGSITEVGIRTSRMRTLEGRLVTIPNSQFTGDMVENVSAEPTRKVVLNLGLTYNTNANQMEQGIDLLKEIANKNEAVNNDYLVAFNAFGDFSLGLIFIYYINKGSDILNTQTAINLEILKQFKENDLEMAFPTQTIYNIGEMK
jgi:MscS family membrane protein